MTTMAAELRALMLPWTRVLRDFVDLGKWSASWNARGDRVVWVEMASDSSRGIELRAFDAMELLTLLGEIDFSAWRVALGAAWPKHASAWIEAANGRALRFGWKISFRSTDDGVVNIAKWCSRIVVDGAECARSPEYLRARAILEDLYQQREASCEKLPRPLPRERLEIPVELAVYNGSIEERLLSLLQVVSLQHARDTSKTRLFDQQKWRPLMRVTDISTGSVAESMSPNAFLSSAQIAALGVELLEVPLHQMDVTIDRAQLYTTGLRQLLGVRGVSGQTELSGAVKRVVIPAEMPRRTVSAIYSALLDSNSLDAVAINVPPVRGERHNSIDLKMTSADYNHLWEWIGIALFSRDASNHLIEASINVAELTSEHVQSFETVLRRDYAGSVKASKFRLLSPETEAPSGVDAVIHLEGQVVRVLQKVSNEWNEVLLPGWGSAWVLDAESEHLETLAARSAFRSIPKLLFQDITASSIAPLVSILQLVGENLKSIELHKIKIGLDESIEKILKACPNLEELKLFHGGHIKIVDSFARNYEKGVCKLQRLELCGVGVADTALMHDFFSMLGDNCHRMAQHLRELDITIAGVETPLPQVSSSLHTMLKANSVLERLHLTVSFRAHVPTDQLVRITEFLPYEVPIAVRLLPLPLRQKIAFLSVTRESETTNRQAGALHQLDSQIISLIFQFGARCRKRSVCVYFENSRRHPMTQQ